MDCVSTTDNTTVLLAMQVIGGLLNLSFALHNRTQQTSESLFLAVLCTQSCGRTFEGDVLGVVINEIEC